MIWDKIVEIGGSRIGVLLFEDEDAKKRAQSIMDFMALDPEQNKVVSKSVEGREIAVIIGLADNRQIG